MGNVFACITCDTLLVDKGVKLSFPGVLPIAKKGTLRGVGRPYLVLQVAASSALVPNWSSHSLTQHFPGAVAVSEKNNTI